jgi:methyl-accepting chemotaxis protein WspA
MNTSIWKRLTVTLAISIASLLLASGLAWWIERTRSDGQQLSDQLNLEINRIRYDASQISDALRALLLDPQGPREPEEHKRVAASLGDLKDALDYLEKKYAKDTRVAPQIKSLQDFRLVTLDLHVAKTLEGVAANPSLAREAYVKADPEVAKQRDKLVNELILAFEKIRKESDIRAQNTAITGSVGMVIVLIFAWWAIRSASSAITLPLNQLVGVIERMRNGDFTQRVNLVRKDEFGVLGDGLNRLADDLSVLVGQVQRSGVQVNITATEISATAKEQQSTTTEIAATTAEIGATSKQISATSRELDKTMNEVGEVAQDTAELASSGQTGIARMENTMRQIMEASGSISGKLAVLNEKTGNINTVVTTITKVADQTNLLSLNAAIEAEKAGEYGLGFAVVAMEIRRLADQTAVATYDIERMVKEMQSAVSAGVMGMDKFSEEVRRGVEEIRQVSTHLAQIIHQVQTLTPRFATVSEGMHAQSTGAQQISETLTQLSEAAHQTADSLRQSNIAIEQLNEAARGLQTSVARFKLEAK